MSAVREATATARARPWVVGIRAFAPAAREDGRVSRVRRVVGGVALAGVPMSAAAMAVVAAAAPSPLVPFSERGLSGWLSGPTGGLLEAGAASTDLFSLLVLAMAGCYAAILVLARADRLPTRSAVAAVVLAHLVLALAPPLLSGDLFGYLIFARLGALHGLDPYVHGQLAPLGEPMNAFVRWPSMRSPYGPLFTLAGYPLAHMGVPGALWTLKAAAGAAGLACAGLAAACARRLGRRALGAAVWVGLNPLVLVWGVGGAHNDLLAVAVLLLGVWLLLGTRPGAGAAVAAAAVGVKATAGLALPFLVLGASGHRRRAAAGAVLGTAAVTALVLAAFGLDGLEGLIGALSTQSRLVSFHGVPHHIGAALGLGGVAGVTPALRTLCTAALAAGVGLALLRAHRSGDWLAGAGWAILALLLTSTWLMPWYAIWLLPFAALGDSDRLRAATVGFTAFVLASRLAGLPG